MNEPVKCPDCGLWWRTDTHRCEEKKAEVKPVAPFVKSSSRKHHNAKAYCLKCYKSGTVYFEHDCIGGYKPYSESTWTNPYNYTVIKKDYNKHEPKFDKIYYNEPPKKSCKCGKDSK